MNIVIIPCWKRPGFLAACTTLIQRAINAENYHYIFAVDRGAEGLNDAVIEKFPYSYEIFRPGNHTRWGNTINLLKAYQYAASLKPELIYLIEEDIFIAENFFTFHEMVWKDHNPFFVCACEYHKAKVAPIENEVSAIFGYNRYQSLGVSFKTETVLRFAAHGNVKYFNNPKTYLQKTFPHCNKGFGWEQDGLIDNVLCDENASGIYPVVPRAFHAGFVGYNRTGQGITANSVNLWEVAEKLINMSESEMNDRAKLYKDITRCDLTGNTTDSLHLI